MEKKTIGCIDVHCHILPGLDDGSRSMGETLRMLRIAEAEGIACIVCTPHAKPGRRRVAPGVVEERIRETEGYAREEGIGVRLLPGSEALYFDGISEALEQGRIGTMNGSRFVLVEFLPGDQYRSIRNALGEIGDAGYRPILAHAERYECMIKRPEYVGELRNMGVRIQINAAAVTGECGFGVRRFAARLLREEAVDYIGTDAHGSVKRAPRLARCRKLLQKRYGAACADALLFRNAARDFAIEG